MKKRCELCSKAARMFCSSDEASLCWGCDSRVHAANFLVAKHTRTLLCHVCQSPTAWTGSGTDLGPTVSVCQKCAARREGIVTNDDGDDDVIIEDDDDDEDENDDGDDDEDDGENQVVPLSPPPSTSSSTAGQEASSSSSSRRSERFCGFVDNSRFPYNAINTREEKNEETEKRAWAWR